MKRYHLSPRHLTVILLPMIVLVVMTPFFEKPRALFTSIVNTGISSIRLTYRDAFRGYFKSLDSEDIGTLREQRNSLARFVGEKNIIEEENKNLKQLLQFKERSGLKILGARIIAKSTDLGRSMIVIDRGAHDGVKKNFPVIAQDGVLIGKIVDARYETSFVRLLHDPKSKTIASYRVKDKTVQGLVTGKFHTGIELTLIPITEPVEKDALLTTTGTEEYIPAGLLIGFISEFNSVPTDLFYTIQIRAALGISELSLVNVILPPDEHGD